MNAKNKTIAILMAAIMVSAAIVPIAMAGKLPAFNQNQEAEATVMNSCPEILEGWVEIINNSGVVVYNTSATTNIRPDPHVWESEKLRIYVWIRDKNSIEDFAQHYCEAWLSPGPPWTKITDMQMYPSVLSPTFRNESKETLFSGEWIVPNAITLSCDHDIVITDTDKYGCSAINQYEKIVDVVYFNPSVSSSFTPLVIKWGELEANDVQKPAHTNSHIEHVAAKCGDIPVKILYDLSIKGTDFEGGVSTSDSIPCENVKYNVTKEGVEIISKRPLTNADELVKKDVESCQNVYFNFFMDVPPISPGDYYGQIGLDIRVTE